MPNSKLYSSGGKGKKIHQQLPWVPGTQAIVTCMTVAMTVQASTSICE